ncbi:E3 SUMO-protein ligase KIAA1586-like [Rhinichthys klamathensis goyatoka]|uniref:E3 SUMO-protein ligase KIAA1586-like n=1 Tax=Rhinichthys klamathensis goyatoka TaxID=3034132 RepID=UPI0024B5FEA3|nr:E3 SUMO-protein ligase KIAA1586-like [Rhinichthys klamathensis goyatoka]
MDVGVAKAELDVGVAKAELSGNRESKVEMDEGVTTAELSEPLESKAELDEGVTTAELSEPLESKAELDEGVTTGKLSEPLECKAELDVAKVELDVAVTTAELLGPRESRVDLSLQVTMAVLPLRVAMLATLSRDLPAGWTAKQVGEWKDRNPWLDIKAGKLGCLVCRKAKTLLLSEKGPGLHLAEEWINGDVTSSEAKRLRKKIYKHRDSQAHARSVDIAQMKEKDTLPHFFIDIQSDLLKKTTVSFRTAYTVAKERLSYKKLNPLMTMQELNGAEVGNIHKSDHACAEIISHIAKEMRRKFVCNVKEKDSRVSITIDESTIHGSPYLIIYVRCDVSGKGDVDNVFLDLVELTNGVDAESIYNSMMASLHKARMDDDFLKTHLISIATDGAAVLTGKASGLVVRLKERFPNVQSVHCLAHRLELAVKDALKEVAGTNQFEFFISKLYSLYNQSTRNARLLREAAAELNVEILKIGQIFTIRWVASSFKTVKAVWKDFPALALHFKTASEDTSRNDLERQKYKGLLKHLVNSGFVEDLAVMKDILRELQSLSLKLQKREMSLVDSSLAIQQTINVLAAMKTTGGGKSTKKAEKSVSSGLFKGVELNEGRAKINRSRFHESVIASLTKRLPESNLVLMLKALDKRFWPGEQEDLILHGEPEVHSLAKALGEPTREAVEQFRDWKLQGTAPGKTLERLCIASRTYLPTSAECERGFSAVNNTSNQTRNRLREDSLSSLLFVDLNGSPLDKFDPVPFVRSWIKAGHRLSSSWKPGRQPQEVEPRHLWSILT